jgi:hypothetical protein
VYANLIQHLLKDKRKKNNLENKYSSSSRTCTTAYVENKNLYDVEIFYQGDVFYKIIKPLFSQKHSNN